MEIAKDLRENSPFCMAKLLKLEIFFLRVAPDNKYLMV